MKAFSIYHHSVPGVGNVINYGAPHGFEPQKFEVKRGQFFMPHEFEL